MLSRIKRKDKKQKGAFTYALKKDRRGISIMVGYVLLVSLAIIMGGVIYTWMKTYVPKDSPECPDGSSILIKDYSYDCAGNILNITLKNNGRFSIAGYYIRATNNTNQTIATIDLSRKVWLMGGFFPYKDSVVLNMSNDNTLSPNEEVINVFDVAGMGQLETIEVIPTRWQKNRNKLEYVSCGSVSKPKEVITCN